MSAAIDLAAVRRRQPARHEEQLDGKPYDLFFIQSAGCTYVGRKTECTLPGPSGPVAMKCALVTAPMLLGLFDGARHSEAAVAVYYRPLASEEKDAVFATFLGEGGELRYPYPRLGGDGRRERSAPPEYWNSSPERVAHLNLGEVLLREHTLAWLTRLDLGDAIANDPACSTGEFLSSIQARFPRVRTIGQDLSPDMVEHARTRIDEVHLGDARDPCVAPDSVDLLFVRFLNVDVVTTAQAHALFPSLVERCREGGRLFVLGHTPVLLDAPWFEMLGLEIEQRVGVSPALAAAFQYYVLRRVRGGTR